MGKYCTDCKAEIEKPDGNDMMAFAEVVRCKKCLGAKEGGGFGGFDKMGDGGFGDFMTKKDDDKKPPAGTA